MKHLQSRHSQRFRVTPLALGIMAMLPISALAAEESVFTLGEINVTASALSPSILPSTQIDSEDMRRNDRETVGGALDLAAGVNLSKVGARNEQMVYVRGFDLRQVPLFIDGIPVYVPYDGYVDLGRFNTFDLSRIEVAKGFSSMMYGANTIGGAINLVSRRPSKAFEGEVGAGITMTGDGDTNSYRAYANLGTNQGKWYFQASASYLDQDYFPLSSDFRPVAAENGGNRENSYNRDSKINLKFGLTPNATDEYTVNYIAQHGVKGTPPYAGTVTGIFPRYWRWPYWDKDSLYFLTNTAIGEHSVKLRVYHDTFKNSLFAYDNANYTSQVKPSSFQSWYDDYTNGMSVEGDFRLSAANQLKASYHWKEDIHREHNWGEPIRHFKDRTQSVSLEDTHAFNNRLSLVSGLGFDKRDTLEAQDYNATTKVVSDFVKDDASATNGQIGVFYQTSDTGKLQVSIARKSRFPTIKDRYSYRLGTAIPNPGLKAEQATHYEIGYSGRINHSILGEVHLFYSDITNLIQSSAIAPSLCSSPPCTQMQNVGKASSSGLELSARGELASHWEFAANYAYLDRRNRSASNIRLTDAPRHKLFASTTWKPASQWDITASVDALSSRYSSSDGKQTAAGFAVADLKAGYTLKNGVKVEGGVRNLFDRLYYYTEGFPEAGRTYFVQFNAPL